MIAPERIAPPAAPRIERRARAATSRRHKRARRAVHAPLLAVALLTVAVLVPLLAYVALTANVTSLNFAVAREARERDTLLEETQRLDDRIARLKAPERLAALATRLGMHDPRLYAVVRLPDPKPQPRPAGFALLGEWLKGKY